MATDAEKRAMMILCAMQEVNDGSHYMKGSSGSIPGEDNSGLCRNAEYLENPDIKSKNWGVFAARNSFGTCQGRWDKMVGGKQFVKGQYDRDTLLPKYLDELKLISDPWQWDSFEGTWLYPRLADDFIFLGEDCWQKRHFDCEGFIAWVLVKALGKDQGTWKKGVDWYQSTSNKRLEVYQASGASYVSSTYGTITQNDIRDGDILIRKPSNKKGTGEHIAFACAKGTGVLEASGRSRGVIRSTYTANWTQLARIKNL